MRQLYAITGGGRYRPGTASIINRKIDSGWTQKMRDLAYAKKKDAKFLSQRERELDQQEKADNQRHNQTMVSNALTVEDLERRKKQNLYSNILGGLGLGVNAYGSMKQNELLDAIAGTDNSVKGFDEAGFAIDAGGWGNKGHVSAKTPGKWGSNVVSIAKNLRPKSGGDLLSMGGAGLAGYGTSKLLPDNSSDLLRAGAGAMAGGLIPTVAKYLGGGSSSWYDIGRDAIMGGIGGFFG